MLLVPTIQYMQSARISSSSLTTHDVRLMRWNEATSLGDFPALSCGMTVATLQICGQQAVRMMS